MGPIGFGRADPTPVRDKSSSFQSFAPYAKTRSIPPQHLDLVGTPIDEAEQMSTQGILLHLVARQSIETIIGFAGIHGLAVDEDPNPGFGEEHQVLVRVSMTPPPKSSFSSSVPV